MLSLLLDAAWMTLGLALASLVGGMVLALAFSAAELSKRSWLVWPVATLTTLIRGLPELLVVLLLPCPLLVIGALGMLLVPGMVFTIEPMVNMGTWKVFIDADDEYGWEVISGDEKPSAQWEHTFVMTEHGVEILTH
jgi:His/Glu/Gln/Arg/opine family amino acid ABC transporter permease subunit